MNTWIVESAIAGLMFVKGVQAATFDGYECLVDCAGHQAGYDWAEQNQIDDESSCNTTSNSFNEGCASFVQGGTGTLEADEDEDEDDE
ncbi:hypothetical protein AB3464_28540 [Pseudomonas asplenii]|uniref:hypothetical protein n=1 Tax=Pseudomonas asplenii TaxID=53407 RepID=UPI0037CAD2DB